MLVQEIPPILNFSVAMAILCRHVWVTEMRRIELAAAGVVPPTDPARPLDGTDVAFVVGTLAVGWAIAGCQAALLRSAEVTRRTVAIGLGWSAYVAVSTWSLLHHPAQSRAENIGVSLVWTFAVLAHGRDGEHAMWAPWSLGLATLVLALTGDPAQTLLLLVAPAPLVAYALRRAWRRRVDR